MYIETRTDGAGKIIVKLHKGFAYPKLEGDLKTIICIESINSSLNTKVEKSKYAKDDFVNKYDFETLDEWVNKNFSWVEDIGPIIYELKKGEWVDTSKYYK